MSFKQGWKAVYEPQTSSYEPSKKYTVYAANESVSDITVYKVFDESGKEIYITSLWEDDCSEGRESLIDVLYHLKHKAPGEYDCGAKWRNITIEEMSWDEIHKFFSNS